MTASYVRPTSKGSIGRYGACQAISADADALLLRPLLQVLQALLDRVLVTAGERGVDQIARVRVARVDRQIGAVLHGATDLVDA